MDMSLRWNDVHSIDVISTRHQTSHPQSRSGTHVDPVEDNIQLWPFPGAMCRTEMIGSKPVGIRNFT
jgi:hypothetical protein